MSSRASARPLLMALLELLAQRGQRLEEIKQLVPKRARVAVALGVLRSEGLVSVVSSEAGAVYATTALGVAALSARGVDVSRGDRHLAVMFTDLVSSTSLIELLGEGEAHAARLRHFALLRSVVACHRGREVKCLGDGLMVVFDDPSDALPCAQEMQRVVRGDPDGCRLRVGIDAGRPMRADGDYFGTPVITAKRLCDIAAADEVLVTDRACALIGSDPPVEVSPRGALSLKGFADPVPASVVAVG